MGREVEVKLRIGDAAAVRSAVRSAGGVRGGRTLEDNRIFDRADGALLAADCGLRVRFERPIDLAGGGASAVLTFKGPRERGALKSREEIETPVSDGLALVHILARLGYREVIRYEKRRETLHLGDCVVVLDELPRLGWFAEIEGPDAAAVQDVRQRIGLGAATVEAETYVQLAAARGERDEAGVLRLVFQPGSPPGSASFTPESL